MRKPNAADAELLLRVYELRREPEMRAARRWFLTSFKPESWAEIQTRYLSHSDEDRWFRMVTSYWEMVAALVRHGALHAELFYDTTGEDVAVWDRCKAWVPEARATFRPSYLWQLERLATGHLAHRARVNAAFGKGAAARPARPRARKRSG